MAITRSNYRSDFVSGAACTFFYQKRDQIRQAMVRHRIYRAMRSELSAHSEIWVSRAATSNDWHWRRQMAFGSQAGDIAPQRSASALVTLSSKASEWLSILARIAIQTVTMTRSPSRAFQTTRIMAILSQMNDHQLEQIGITRSEILKYAEKLMAK